jgi:hypothetical protein
LRSGRDLGAARALVAARPRRASGAEMKRVASLSDTVLLHVDYVNHSILQLTLEKHTVAVFTAHPEIDPNDVPDAPG